MNKYEVLGIVGEGAYGMVLKCRNNETGEIVAVKKIKEGEDDEMVRKTIVREVKTLRALQHENIVRLREAFKRKGKLYMVFEFLEKNLLEVLDESPDGLPQPAVRSYIFQLLRAVAFCHSRSIIHRDIKPENLLISKNRDPIQNALPGLGAGILKLCDFGFARPLQGSPPDLTDYVSTRWYRAPELLVGQPYSFPVDIWAIGCIMGELSDGQPLFPGDSDIDQLYVIQRALGPVPAAMAHAFATNARYRGLAMPSPEADTSLPARFRGVMAPEALDLMSRLLAMDPAERPTGEEALRHPYFDPIHAAAALHAPTLDALKAGALRKASAGAHRGHARRAADAAPAPAPKPTAGNQDSVSTQAVQSHFARDAEATSLPTAAAAVAGVGPSAHASAVEQGATESAASSALAALASRGLYSTAAGSRPISSEQSGFRVRLASGRQAGHLPPEGAGGNPLLRQAASSAAGKSRKRDTVSPTSSQPQPGHKRLMQLDPGVPVPSSSGAGADDADAAGGKKKRGVMPGAAPSRQGSEMVAESTGPTSRPSVERAGGGMGAGPSWRQAVGAPGPHAPWHGEGYGGSFTGGGPGVPYAVGAGHGDGGGGPWPAQGDVKVVPTGWGSRGGFGRPILAGIQRVASGQAGFVGQESSEPQLGPGGAYLGVGRAGSTVSDAGGAYAVAYQGQPTLSPLSVLGGGHAGGMPGPSAGSSNPALHPSPLASAAPQLAPLGNFPGAGSGQLSRGPSNTAATVLAGPPLGAVRRGQSRGQH